jgi:hypothetical protein
MIVEYSRLITKDNTEHLPQACRVVQTFDSLASSVVTTVTACVMQALIAGQDKSDEARTTGPRSQLRVMSTTSTGKVALKIPILALGGR